MERRPKLLMVWQCCVGLLMAAAPVSTLAACIALVSLNNTLAPLSAVCGGKP